MKSLRGAPFFKVSLPGGAARTPALRQLRHYSQSKSPGLKQATG